MSDLFKRQILVLSKLPSPEYLCLCSEMLVMLIPVLILRTGILLLIVICTDTQISVLVEEC